MSEEKSGERQGVTRLAFMKAGAGALAGAATLAVPAAIANAAEQRVEVQPSSAHPREPVLAYVRDAKRGEVTVVAGTSEKTYRDPALVKRLLAAAPKQHRGGGR